MELTNEALTAVNKYFSALTHLGYKKDEEVNKLIVFLFLEEFLCGSMSQFITEQDYNDIDKALYCIYGTSCMMPFPDYKTTHLDVVKSMPDEYRISEEGILRMTELNNLRTLI